MRGREPQPQNEARRSVLRGAGVLTLLTAFSRVLGLVREQVRGYYLGTGAASDAFGLASVIPNLFRRLLAEGAMTAAFVPVFAEYRRRATQSDTNLFLSRFFTLFSFLVTIVTIAGVLVTPWFLKTFFKGFGDVQGKLELTIILTQIMWPYLLLVSLAAVIQAILNSYRIFAPSAVTPVLLNLVTIGIVMLCADWFPDPSYAFAIGFVAGGMLQLGFQIPFLRGHGLKILPRWSLDTGVRKVISTFIPGVFSAGIYQVNVLVSQFVASTLSQGAVASLQFSLRLQELVLGLFAVSVTTVVLPVMSDQVVDRDFHGVKDTLGFSIGLVTFVTLPASVGLILIGEPLVRLLFEWGAFDRTSTHMTAYALYFHAGSIGVIALSRIISQVFYAMKDLRTPTLVAFVVMLVHAGLCVGLAIPLAHGGVALAGGIATTINIVLLWIPLRIKLGRMGTRKIITSISKITLASTVMGITVWSLGWVFEPMEIESRIQLGMTLLGMMGAGIVVFLACARLFRANELVEVVNLVRRRAERRNRATQ
ncbi:MAG: murein biosynthesis integral membrane protein MurJ [Myxococcales bacterium]|nr:murein biosynthesis integral membrane protein MurJ [Myxococcales bacterium]